MLRTAVQAMIKGQQHYDEQGRVISTPNANGFGQATQGSGDAMQVDALGKFGWTGGFKGGYKGKKCKDFKGKEGTRKRQVIRGERTDTISEARRLLQLQG